MLDPAPLSTFRGVETHHHDGVGTHGCGTLHHAIDRVTSGVLQQPSVRMNLSTTEGFEDGHTVATEATATHDHSIHLSQGFVHPIPR